MHESGCSQTTLKTSFLTSPKYISKLVLHSENQFGFAKEPFSEQFLKKKILSVKKFFNLKNLFHHNKACVEWKVSAYCNGYNELLSIRLQKHFATI